MKLNVKGLNDAKGTRFEALEPGLYHCRITKVEEKKAGEQAKHPGRPYLSFKATIVPGEENEGRSFFFNISLPCEGMKGEELSMCANNMKRLALACEINVTSDELDSQDFMGTELLLRVTKRMYQGEEKNDVKDYLPLSFEDSSEPEAADPDIKF